MMMKIAATGLIVVLPALMFIPANTVFAQNITGRSGIYSFEIVPEIQEAPPVKPGQIENNKIIFRSEAFETADSMNIDVELMFGKYYALIIGVNEYADPNIIDLDQPITDATALYDILIRQYTFDKENIIKLLNPNREEILSSLENLSRRITERDNLLIFYAGHGTWDDKIKTGYWLPADATYGSTTNWFRNSTLRDYVAGINSKHTLVIADACFSGAIFKTRSISQSTMDQNEYGAQKLYNLPSRKAMTSGTMETVPDQSVFLLYLSKRLKENEHKYLSSEELFSLIRRAVLNNSPNIPQFGEIMNAGDEGGDFIFIQRE